MSSFDLKREMLKISISKYILDFGIKNASLKKMAIACSTSDRMLLHYFKDKEEILKEALLYINNSLILILENKIPQKMHFDEIILYISDLLKEPDIDVYMRLWFELIDLSSSNNKLYYNTAREICVVFFEWINKIYINEDGRVKNLESLILVIIEGFVVLDRLDFNLEINKAIESIMHLYKINNKLK